MRIADRCITILAELYANQKTSFNAADAKEYLNVSDEDFAPVIRILESLKVIIVEAAAGESYDRITILPRAVELAHKDLVEHWFSWFRRQPFLAVLMVVVIVLTAIASAANQGMTVVRNLYPAATSAQRAVSYKGHPPEYWTERLYDLDSVTAREASSAAWRLGADAVPGLIRALNSKNPYTVELAVRTLGDIGQAASAAVTELERLGQQAQPALKSNVEQALGKIRKQ
jgi:hypothetical protein